MTYDDMFDHEIPDGDEQSSYDAEDEAIARMESREYERMLNSDYDADKCNDQYVHDFIWRE